MGNKYQQRLLFIMFIFAGVLSFSCTVAAAKEDINEDINIEEENVDLETDTVKISLEIPIIEGFTNDLFQEKINTSLKHELIDFAYQLHEQSEDTYDDFLDKDLFNKFVAQNSFVVERYEQYISIILKYNQYQGGAHGLQWQQSYTFDLKEEKQLELKDLIDVDNYQEKITKEICQQIKGQSDDYFDENIDSFDENSFYVTENGIVIYYAVYEIAPYALGIPEFLIPWSIL
ncbi:MAG: DUF3298 and DUF4163 domain-containing protein [bacterium]